MAENKPVYRSLIYVPSTASLYFGMTPSHTNNGYETTDVEVATKAAETYITTYPQYVKGGFTAIVVQVTPEFRIVKMASEPPRPLLNWEDVDEGE